jgi:hypothetical protein
MFHVELIYAVTSLVVVVGLWLVPSLLTARLAARKGRSFTAYLIAALFLCWPLVLFVVLIVRHRSPTA